MGAQPVEDIITDENGLYILDENNDPIEDN